MRAIKCKVCGLEHWGVCSHKEAPPAVRKEKAKAVIAAVPKKAAAKKAKPKGKKP